MGDEGANGLETQKNEDIEETNGDNGSKINDEDGEQTNRSLKRNRTNENGNKEKKKVKV